MYGAILGDIVGSPYEFDCNNYKAKDFPLFSRRSDFTDDTVMTLAVAKALLSTRGQDDAAIKAALVREMQQLAVPIPTGAMAPILAAGSMRTTRSPTRATATAAPCGCLPPHGWQQIWRKRCVWRGSPPR